MAFCLSPPSNSVVTSAWGNNKQESRTNPYLGLVLLDSNMSAFHFILSPPPRHLNSLLFSYLGLRNELSDLLAGVEGRHLDVSDPPVGSSRRLKDLIMLLQNLPETGEVQVL